jgi:hypothetical protein
MTKSNVMLRVLNITHEHLEVRLDETTELCSPCYFPGHTSQALVRDAAGKIQLVAHRSDPSVYVYRRYPRVDIGGPIDVGDET